MKNTTVKTKIAMVLVGLMTSLQAVAQPATEVKSDSLKYLQDLRSQNVRRLQEIDRTLNQKLETESASQIETEVSALQTAKKEHVLRQEFLDRLIFQIDTKFIGGDLKPFLERTLVDMAKVDATNSSTDTGIWKFLKYASDAVRTLPEKKENILSFLAGYMNRSVANPVKPDDYISSRNYTNGLTSESGAPLGRDQVGAYADRRLQELSEQAPATGQKPEQKAR